MKELKALLAQAELAEGPLWLATVVETQGSVYRRPGARMLISEGLPLHGLVSGGCLEGDLAERSLSGPQLVTYDNAEELWGAGIGCNGVISLWLEPLTPRLLQFWQEALEQRRPARSALMYRCIDSAQSEDRSRFAKAQESRKPEFGPAATNTSFRLGQRWFDNEIPVAWQSGHYHGQGWSVFVEQLRPPPHLVVCGAGPDAVPLVAGAVRLGWDVQVVDHRPGFLEPGRFPGASLSATPDICQNLVIMSHSLERDRGYLELALASRASYIGMLGPRERTRRLLKGRQDARLHGPVGLDLGSETPEEIALSILAEIMAVQSNRQAGHLKERNGRVLSSDRT